MRNLQDRGLSRRGVLGALSVAAMGCRAARGAEPASSGKDRPDRCGFWIDLCSGEPIAEDELIDDLATVQVVYLGERHSVARHHDLETWVVGQLANRKRPLVLGLEQMESIHQATLDRYAKREISFEQLAEATKWAKRWSGHEQYKPVLETARGTGAPILALNARSETVRQVSRSGGVARLDPALRRQLPPDMQLADPAYEKLVSLHMMVHMAATPQRLRPMIEAQIVRDEVMAFTLASFLQSAAGKGRTAVVVCGAGHVEYGLGTAARVRRRMSGVKDRIVLFSESGDVELSAAELAVSRPVEITHEQLRELNRPVGDYLHAASMKAKSRPT